MPPTERPDRLIFGASLALPLGPDNEPPREFLVWPYGATRFRWADGEEHEIELTPERAQRLVAAFERTGRQLAVDYNHASLNSVDADEARAAGWFDLELRDDGLWAVNVTWTEQAAAYLRAREYRYTSPTWAEDDSGPTELLNLALTINPATLGALPLVASLTRHLTAPAVETPPSPGAGEEHTVLRIASALGLPETAGETEVATRAAALRAFEATVLERLGVTDREAAVTALEERDTRLREASQRLAELEAAAEADTREQLISAALREGRLTPAQAGEGGWARTTPLATLREFLASAPRVVPTGQVGEGEPPAEKGWNDMTGPERAQLYVTDKARYLELRKAATGR